MKAIRRQVIDYCIAEKGNYCYKIELRWRAIIPFHPLGDTTKLNQWSPETLGEYLITDKLFKQRSLEGFKVNTIILMPKFVSEIANVKIRGKAYNINISVRFSLTVLYRWTTGCYCY